MQSMDGVQKGNILEPLQITVHYSESLQKQKFQMISGL